ncbi:MAG: glycoside hydrolase family 32 protein [Nitriliruptoraceae bacterium]|nr:glycoside hydrolase family 32 protein [Nitriliruptoraceae bacterium]
MPEHRPIAHLRPHEGWTNDPTGPVRWQGRVHLFHQHNPAGGFWHAPQWGHLVTEDLVHWQRRPTALAPDPDGVDADGCFSGCVVVDGDEAVMVYTGVRGASGPGQQQATCLARSGDAWLDDWVRDPANPVTTAPADRVLRGFRDPYVWREGGAWWQLIGAGSEDVGGTVLLFRSHDLVTWEPLGPALTSAQLRELSPDTWTGDMWECPVVLRGADTDALVLSLHDETTIHYPVAVLGRLEDGRFRARAIQRLDLGPDLYAPCLLPDGDGRAISWAWSPEARTPDRQRAEGWAGVLSAPRVLEIVEDRVRVAPLPALAGLRDRHLDVEVVPTPDGWLAGGVVGDVLDLELALGAACDTVALRVRRSPGLEEVTIITVDREAGQVWLDRDRASLDPTATGGHLGGDTGVALPVRRVRVLLDRSLVEVFVDDEVALTARIYPARDDSTGVEVVGSPAAVADVRLRAWTLGSIWGEGAED